MAGEKSQKAQEYNEPSSDNEHSPPPYTPTPGESSSTAAPQAPHNKHRPIAIPTFDQSPYSPFIRAYAPILKDHNLPQESFLSFLDQLNQAVSSNPPFQVLDATGGLLQSVPLLFPLRWIGSAVSELANLGSHGMSKSRSDTYIRQANRDIFGPRGLKAEIVKLDALAYMADIPILDSQGKFSRSKPVSRELKDAKRSTATDVQGLDIQQRWIKILQPWIAELELAVLPWTSKSKLSRFNATLKKRNDPESSSTSKRGKDPCFDEDEDDISELRKGLWLVIMHQNAS